MIKSVRDQLGFWCDYDGYHIGQLLSVSYGVWCDCKSYHRGQTSCIRLVLDSLLEREN